MYYSYMTGITQFLLTIEKIEPNLIDIYYIIYIFVFYENDTRNINSKKGNHSKLN